MPTYTNDLSSRRYNFDVKDVSSQNVTDRSKPEAKLEQYRRAQEAHILMNALPEHIREKEMSAARTMSELTNQQTKDRHKFMANCGLSSDQLMDESGTI